MSDDAETDVQPKDAPPVPWSVKGMTRERRDAIMAAARRADMPVAQFIWDACQARIEADRLPMGTVPARHTGSSLAPYREASSGGAASVDELEKLTALAMRLSADEVKKNKTDTMQAARRAVIARLTELG
jgi:hypothetical protein